MKKISLVNPAIFVITASVCTFFVGFFVLFLTSIIKLNSNWYVITLIGIAIGGIGFLIMLYYEMRLKIKIDCKNKQIISFSKFRAVKIAFKNIKSISVGKSTSLDFNTFYHLKIFTNSNIASKPIEISLSFLAFTKKGYSNKKDKIIKLLVDLTQLYF